MKNNSLDPAIYIDLSYDDLVVYALHSIIDQGKDPSFENLVVECFILFPKKFGLPGFTDIYPDSAQVNKSWLRCRTDKGLISGSKAQGFQLTDRGLNLAKEISSKLNRNINKTESSTTIKGDRRTRSGRLIMEIENSVIYHRYKNLGEATEISDFEFCDLIYTTLDSSPETMCKHLKLFLDAASDYERTEIKAFLLFCQTKFRHLLLDKHNQKDSYYGGMMKRKNK